VSDDWLDIEETLPAVITSVPATLPAEAPARAQLVLECWARLSQPQKKFLTAFRDAGLNARKANGGEYTNSNHTKWMRQADYQTIVRIWRGECADEAVNRDRLLVRQDNIVEELLTPKPILHQGLDTGFKEIQAAGAAKANETLMRAAGLLKDKDIDVNVGIIGPAMTIAVQLPSGEVRQLGLDGAMLPVIDAEIVEKDDWLDS
jgi:hypothetical protein